MMLGSPCTVLVGRWSFVMMPVLLCWGASVVAAEPLDEWKVSLQHGKYDESIDGLNAYLMSGELPSEKRIRAAILLSRAQRETGKYDAAVETLRAGIKADGDSAELWAHLAAVYFEQGEYPRTAGAIRKSLDFESQQPLARLIRAQLMIEQGDVQKAVAEFRWFVRHYNRVQPTDAESIMIIASGSAEYARYDNVTQIFKFIVNTLCPDALKDDELHWQAMVLSGELLLEKYNEGQAHPEFDAALKVNEHCVPALVGFGISAIQDRKYEIADGFADKALDVNPSSIDALLIKADVAIFASEFESASEFVKRAMEVNPIHQGTLAREAYIAFEAGEKPSLEEIKQALTHLKAGSYAKIDEENSFLKTLKTIARRNPKPGVYLSTLGTFFDARLQYPYAEVFYQSAIDVMPELSAPQTSLGLLAMRTGDVDRAKEILDGAFEADPFHVRVSNMRKVLGVLKSYETVETDHFIIHAHESEMVLAHEMANYLEDIYPELVSRYGYEPPARTHFEIYSDTKDQNAHAWFSARMTGMPWIQTIGASTGRIVALASPQKTQKKYHWARVLRHEFVHILTLQKTEFNIPHWYTEAIAVTEENIEMPESWQEMLQDRVPRDRVFKIANLNSGFQRPKDRTDWSMAYCQSWLCAQCLTAEFGDGAVRKLLDAYRTTRDSKTAFEAAFGSPLDEFEKTYRDYLTTRLKDIDAKRSPRMPSGKALRKLIEDDPDDVNAKVMLARILFVVRRTDDAIALLDEALELDEDHPEACALRAFQLAASGDADDAKAFLDHVHTQLDSNGTLNASTLQVASRVSLLLGETERAKQYAERGIENFPLEVDFQKSLLKWAEETDGDANALWSPLVAIASNEYDNVEARKRLARLAVTRKQSADALKWAEEAIFIDAMDADMHRIVANAAVELKQSKRAIQAFETLDRLNVMTPAEQFEFAKLLKRTGQRERAKSLLNEVLQSDADHKEARTLLKILDQGL